MTAHRSPVPGEKVVIVLHSGGRILGRVSAWSQSGDVLLADPARRVVRPSIKEWWYSA